MTDDRLADRVAAVERALLDGDHDLDGLAERAALEDRIDDIEERVEGLDERVAELEAASGALRGYVGGVRAVNADVERRADAALAKVESLERAVETEPGLTVEEVDLSDARTANRDGDIDPAGKEARADEREPGATKRREREGRAAGDGDQGGGGDARPDLAARLRDLL